MDPSKAIVRPPGKTFVKCLSCHPLRDTIDLALAREQHESYRSMLSELGVEVIGLPPDDSHPDACFVEDNAVVHGGRALICRMGAESRRGEEVAVESALKSFVRVRRVEAPATIEGGDVVHLQNRLVSGISQRTNRSGVDQLASWLEVAVDMVEDQEIMHLKSYVTYLGKGVAIASKRFAKHPALQDLTLVVVPDSEAYAADTLTIGNTVLMPSGMKKSEALVREAGFDVTPLDVSEFEKCDGAITCLSILF